MVIICAWTLQCDVAMLIFLYLCHLYIYYIYVFLFLVFLVQNKWHQSHNTLDGLVSLQLLLISVFVIINLSIQGLDDLYRRKAAENI